ncbi:hypothetical protein MHYP_G00081820 [Metynnis hypsauchen]
MLADLSFSFGIGPWLFTCGFHALFRRAFVRDFFRIKPDRGSKAGRDKVISKRTGQLVQKKALAISPHVCSLMKKLHHLSGTSTEAPVWIGQSWMKIKEGVLVAILLV